MHYGIRLGLVSGAVSLVLIASLSAVNAQWRDVAVAIADGTFSPAEATAVVQAPPTAVAQPFEAPRPSPPTVGAKLAGAALPSLSEVVAGLADAAPPSSPRTYTRDELCTRAAAVAAEQNLPVAFFANLIWQESGFRPHAVSRAGARGIAQFMPATGQLYGLDNPFDPIPALAASGRHLNDLVAQFGNVGLAAAAYNAGAKRVDDWMNRRASLPAETRNYVQRITGRSAEQWMVAKFNIARHRMPPNAPCIEAAMALEAQAKAEAAQMAAARALLAASTSPIKRAYALAMIPEPTETTRMSRRSRYAHARIRAVQPTAYRYRFARKVVPAVQMVRRPVAIERMVATAR
jgi:hypothetical protein